MLAGTPPANETGGSEEEDGTAGAAAIGTILAAPAASAKMGPSVRSTTIGEEAAATLGLGIDAVGREASAP
eukprot:11463049-Prorocentrum_lima.AAC.1